MTSLIQTQSISKSYGSKVLFKDISFSISQGDRIGLIGPNGAGKSTLLKMMMGTEQPDSGSITKRRHLSVGYACQSPEFPSLPLEQLLIKQDLEGDEHELLTRARILLGKAQFNDFSQNASTLSGGWKKRLDIARALMSQPDVLLLDEPTNHLDLEGILWLEQFLNKERFSFVLISHDRYFLENICNKIVELNSCFPQGLLICDGAMSAYMEKKEEFLAAQQQQERGLASTVRHEKEWLSRSPQARTTKSQSRINNAYKMMDELASVKKRNFATKVDIRFSGSERETRKLLTANNLEKSLSGRQLFNKLDITLSPGTRLGIVGKNGTGKTTLLKVLAKMIQPDQGTLKYADDLKIVYFDQHREQIPGDISLRRALSPSGDMLTYHGQEIHVNGWAARFLFSKDRLDLPVRCLSGGERARVLIAKLMLQPADILFLDEPTNDLDIPTLEVMEESLMEFPGALVLITHDRCMMDRVCTKILGLGTPSEQGYYADYLKWEEAAKGEPPILKKPEPKIETAKSAGAPVPKLSYKEQKELQGMEEAILTLEAEIEEIQSKISAPNTAVEAHKSLDLYHILAEKQAALEKSYARWQHLLDHSAPKK